jgi:hypothetical protein
MTKVNWLMRGAGSLMVVVALSGCADNGAITADEAAQISATAPYVYADAGEYDDAYELGESDYAYALAGSDYGMYGDGAYYPGGYWHDHVRHPNDGHGGPFYDLGQRDSDGRNGLGVGNHSFAGSGRAMHFVGGSFDRHAGNLGEHVGGFGGHVGGFGGHAGGVGRG